VPHLLTNSYKTDASTWFFWFAFVPLFMLIPLVYVLWSCGNILYKGMVPPVGRRRNLALYFFRLIFVFVFMWLPFIVITFVVNPALPGPQNPWLLWTGAAWSHLQGLVSVIVSCTKEDIKDCLVGTLTCDHCLKRRRREDNNRRQRNTTITHMTHSNATDDHENSNLEEDDNLAAIRSYSIMRSFNNFSDIGSSIISARRTAARSSGEQIQDVTALTSIESVRIVMEEDGDFQEDDDYKHKLSPKEDIAEVEKEEQNTDIADDSNRSPLDISDRLREEGI